MAPDKTLTLIKTARAADICKHIDLRMGADELLSAAHTPAEFLDLLIEKDHYSSAIRFLAQGLPGREAVWWACLCLRLAAPGRLPDAEERALDAAVRWVVRPSDEHRAQAEQRGTAAGATAAGRLARGAATTGDGAGQPRARAVARAVLDAAEINGDAQSTPYTLKFLAVGTAVANGEYCWQ